VWGGGGGGRKWAFSYPSSIIREKMERETGDSLFSFQIAKEREREEPSTHPSPLQESVGRKGGGLIFKSSISTSFLRKPKGKRKKERRGHSLLLIFEIARSVSSTWGGGGKKDGLYYFFSSTAVGREKKGGGGRGGKVQEA